MTPLYYAWNNTSKGERTEIEGVGREGNGRRQLGFMIIHEIAVTAVYDCSAGLFGLGWLQANINTLEDPMYSTKKLALPVCQMP